MQMSPEGMNALLKQFEGCKLKAYRCPRGICTIGYGHTNAAGAPLITDNSIITQQQANDILRRDLVQYENSVNKLVKQPLTQHQFDVLVDFVYNEGERNLATSTMLRKINAGQFQDVPSELAKFNKAGGKVLPGLVRRRQAEANWWLAADAIEASNENEAPTADEHEQRTTADPVPVPTMANSSQGNAALVTAGLGSLGVAKQVAAQAQDASDTADQLIGLFSNPNFLIMSAIIGLGIAIWFFRKQHMEEHGV